MKNSTDFSFQHDDFGVRNATIADLSAMTTCEISAWAEQAASVDTIRSRLLLHAKTTFIIESIADKKLLGFFVCVPISQSPMAPYKSWSYYAELTLCPPVEISCHLYGVSLTVSPDAPKFTATNLLKGISKWLKESSFFSFSLGMRIPGFKKYQTDHCISAPEYVELVRNKKVSEGGLAACIASGGCVLEVQANYYDDPESSNFGVIVIYQNENLSHFAAEFLLSVEGGNEYKVSSHNGYDWTIHSGAVVLKGVFKGSIRSKKDEIIWDGHFQSNGLSIEIGLVADTETFISLRKFYPTLSPIDRGLCYLQNQEVNEVLEQFIEYNQDTRCQILSSSGTSVACTLGDQESLRELSELFLACPNPSFEEHELLILSVDIFERTLFFICMVAECFDEGIILTLTEHVFRSSKRESYRFKIDGFITPENIEVVEISDTGLKVIINDQVSHKNIALTLESKKVAFEVISNQKLSEQSRTLGLKIIETEQPSLDAWFRFLIRHQFPLLKRRETSDHDKAWQLLCETGFLTGDFGKIMDDRKKAIFNEWVVQDSSESKHGITVLGISEEKPISTIGVAKVSKGAWLTQAAAVIDSPNYLEFTRSMYVWRIRQMLQFDELQSYIAVFDANKKFLDRFFRKFFLKQASTSSSKIKWNEYYSFYCKANGYFQKDSNKTKKFGEYPYRDEIKELLSVDPEPLLTVSIEKDASIYLYSRPHLHLAQPMSAVFLDEEENVNDLDSDLLNRFLETNNNLFTLYFKKNPASDVILKFENAEIFRDEQIVIWLCPREMLPDFLSNTLRSLTDMFRKYGAKNVA
jgi:hypothetical protein